MWRHIDLIYSQSLVPFCSHSLIMLFSSPLSTTCVTHSSVVPSTATTTTAKRSAETENRDRAGKKPRVGDAEVVSVLLPSLESTGSVEKPKSKSTPQAKLKTSQPSTPSVSASVLSPPRSSERVCSVCSSEPFRVHWLKPCLDRHFHQDESGCHLAVHDGAFPDTRNSVAICTNLTEVSMQAES